ncbi:hypothetical protein C8Q78DRAFT_1077978 [Trametes maxima]|nr:hypothetical protein C8Q78DRAFT_1077978 [Trametes maxima]
MSNSGRELYYLDVVKDIMEPDAEKGIYTFRANAQGQVLGCYQHAFVDKTAVYKKVDVEVCRCFDVTAVQTSETFISFSFRFAVAFAATEETYSRPFDGILALGQMNAQSPFSAAETVLTAPSFLASLSSTVDPGGPRRAEMGDRGIILFITLRKLGHSSWVGLNRWPLPGPGQLVQWSDKIQVINDSPTWAVLLESIEVQEYTAGQSDGPDGKHEWRCKQVISFGESTGVKSGIRVSLDTGSALSWLPAKLVRTIRTAVFPTSYNLELDAKKGDASQLQDDDPSYRVPKTFKASGWQVKYTFRGTSGKSVVVLGPADPFLFTANPVDPNEDFYEGLVYTAPNDIFILGQNFFHSMFVCMHNPDPDINHHGRCYVKLSPQYPWDIPKSLLPGDYL